MKKSILTFVLAIIACTINAQTSHFELGIEGGPNVSNYSSYPTYSGSSPFASVSYQPLYAFSIGASCEYSITDRFSLKSGLAYEQKGAVSVITFNNNNGVSYGTEKAPIITENLIVPVFAKYYFGNIYRFFVNGGPYFGYLLKATYDDLFFPGSRSVITGNLKRFDVGAAIGIGISRKIGEKFKIELEARYNYGLISTFLNSGNPLYDRNVSGNLLLGLGYRL